jgi:hypothetical protein
MGLQRKKDEANKATVIGYCGEAQRENMEILG